MTKIKGHPPERLNCAIALNDKIYWQGQDTLKIYMYDVEEKQFYVLG